MTCRKDWSLCLIRKNVLEQVPVSRDVTMTTIAGELQWVCILELLK